jgi:hypothetical protein
MIGIATSVSVLPLLWTDGSRDLLAGLAAALGEVVPDEFLLKPGMLCALAADSE